MMRSSQRHATSAVSVPGDPPEGRESVPSFVPSFALGRAVSGWERCAKRFRRDNPKPPLTCYDASVRHQMNCEKLPICPIPKPCVAGSNPAEGADKVLVRALQLENRSQRLHITRLSCPTGASGRHGGRTAAVKGSMREKRPGYWELRVSKAQTRSPASGSTGPAPSGGRSARPRAPLPFSSPRSTAASSRPRSARSPSCSRRGSITSSTSAGPRRRSTDTGGSCDNCPRDSSPNLWPRSRPRFSTTSTGCSPSDDSQAGHSPALPQRPAGRIPPGRPVDLARAEPPGHATASRAGRDGATGRRRCPPRLRRGCGIPEPGERRGLPSRRRHRVPPG